MQIIIFDKKPEKRTWGDYIYHWRYFIAAVLLFFCVIFELSGSSIAMWGQHLGFSRDHTGDLIGAARAIRSDEWYVNTPFALSQYTADFPYVSNIIRGAATDMFIVYGQPVKAYSILFRPFHWGYLFLPPAKGLSFFWCSRFFFLFMVSFEFGMLFFRKNRMLSFSYGAFVAAAPVVQWWFAVNGLVEMLIYGQTAVIAIRFYLKKSSYFQRIFCVTVLSWLATAYTLLFYPAWQAPFAYAFGFMVIGIIIQNYKKGVFEKKDFLFFFLFVGLSSIELFPILEKSKDTIATVMNTSYPGQRISVGGYAAKYLLSFPTNLWLPFEDLPNLATVNYCSFFSLFPLGAILGISLIIKTKKKDPLLITLLLGAAFLGLYCIVPFPEFLAKLTLLSFSTDGRAAVAFSFINTVLLFYSISRLPKVKFLSWFFCSFLFVSAVLAAQKGVLTEYWGKERMIITWLILFSFCVAIYTGGKRKNYRFFTALCICISLGAGMSVNPVHKGLDVIYENPLYQAIKRIADETNAEDLWLVTTEDHTMANFTIMAGAPTINSTNVYPNLTRFKELDPEAKYYEIYNRYAHISAKIWPSDFSGDTFELKYPDLFQLNLTSEDLEKLNVRFLLSDERVHFNNTDTILFQPVYRWNGFYIYERIKRSAIYE